jgi:hypothetical protein
MGLSFGSGFEKHFKTPSQYSIHGPMTFAYISFFTMFSFQNSKYFEMGVSMV